MRGRAQDATRRVGHYIVLGALLALNVVRPSSIDAQLPASGLGEVPRLDDASYFSFTRRDGVPELPIFALNHARSGTLWLGTGDGPRRFNGSTWSPTPLPSDVKDPSVRAILEGAHGAVYYVHNLGVSIAREGQAYAPSVFLDARAIPIYSATLFQNADGREELLIGAKGGLFRLVDHDRWERVALPPGMTDDAAMVASRAVEGRDELWVGTLGGGVARYRDGKWRRWSAADGLEDMKVEHVVPSPPHDSVEALAATTSGVFALVGDRWRRMGPRVRAVRALRVRMRDHWETWIGTLLGEVIRTRDGARWTPVDVSVTGRGSRVQFLSAIDHGLVEPTVYVGFRSGALLRYRVGIAGKLVTPLKYAGRPVLAMAARPGQEGSWVWMISYGLVRLPEFRGAPSNEAMLDASDASVHLLPGSRMSGSELLVGLERGVFRLQAGAWKPVLTIGEGGTEVVRDLVRSPTPDGSVAPLVLTSTRALIEQPSGELRAWDGFPTDTRAVVVDSNGGGTALLVMSRTHGIQRFSDGRWETIDGGQAPLLEPPVAAVVWRYPSGERALVVGTGDGIGFLRIGGGPPVWRTASHASHVGFRSDEVRDLAALANGRLAVATPRGLVIFQPGEHFGDSLRTVGSFSEADGLPHPGIRTIGSVDADNRLWVGTDLGAGFVNLRAIDSDARQLQGFELFLRDASGRLLPSDAPISADAGRLDVVMSVATYNREDETLFRLELDGAPVTPERWTDRRALSLLTLSSGTHTLRAWASDWRGQQVGPVTRELTVLAPWWRSTPALLLSALVLFGGVVLIDRVRVGGARRRAGEAEANERRLATSEIRFRRLFEDGANAQLLVLDGRIWQANAAAVALLQGHEGPALVDRPVEWLLPGIGAALDGSSHAGERCELVARGAGGESIDVDVRRTRIPLDGSAIDHLELRDLRERKRLEEERHRLEQQLRESQRLESLGTLAGGVAHDFNNLLTVIHANAELAALDVDEASDAGESLQQLMVAARRARDVVRQILTFSRRAPLRREVVPVHTLLAELRSMLRSSIPSTVRLAIEDEAPGACVEGDPTQLQQMLLNLCTNAEHAMRRTNGGVLTVQVGWCHDPDGADEGRKLALRVRDTGSGMSPEVRARIFEPFFTTKPIGEGTGLGLSVLHGIVGSLGGSISVDSALGVGTTVEIVLPTVPEVDGADLLGIAYPPFARPKLGNRILLVDDEPAVAAVLARLLTREGFAVDVLHDAERALERLRLDAAAYELLLTDQTMPRMTGVQLAESVRAIGLAIPIIIASGFGVRLDESQTAALGSIWQLDKPFGADQLLHAVQLAIAHSRLVTPLPR